MGWADGFAQGVQLGRSLIDTYNQAKQQRELSEIADAKPQESQGYTADDGKMLENIASAKNADGSKAYDLTANEDGSYRFTSTADPSASGLIAARGVTDFMGERTAGSMSPNQVNAARMAATAGVLMKTDPVRGAHLMQVSEQAQREASRFSWEQAAQERVASRAAQADADNVALRGALKPQEGDGNDYLKTVAPRAVQELLSQGRVDDAQHLQTFLTGERGQRYASSWMAGVRRFAVGDSQGAVKAFEKLYNEDFDDGHQVKMTPQPDGKSYKAAIFDADGKVVSERTGSIESLVGQAIVALDPVSAAKFHVQQQGKRDAEESTLNRQLELERLRQEGRQDQEDRRDQRLAQRLAHQGGHGLTAAQDRGNQEIDAARQKVAGLSPEEIRRRTAKATNTGRENKDYDPGLARAAALAARRKIGQDDWFDQRQSSPQQAPDAGQDVAARFRADAQMSKYRLGKETPNGREVLDASGKLIGHYR